MYRVTNISLDFFSLCIFVIILLSNLLEKDYKEKTTKCFNHIVINITCLIVADMVDWHVRGQDGEYSYYLMWLSLEIFYIASGFLINNLVNYLKCILEKNGSVSAIFSIIGKATIVFQIIICILTLFTKNIFYVGSDNMYCRGPLYILTQVPVALYLMIIVMIVVYRGRISTREKIYFILFTFTPALGEILQIIIFDIATLMPSFTLGILFLFVFVQKEKKYEDSVSKIENLGSYNKELENSQEHKNEVIKESMEVLTSISEIRMSCTKGHGRRVGNYAREIAYRMGLSEDFQVQAYFAGMLHDIGMIKVPDEIVNKEGRLTDNEYDRIKLHTVDGYHLIKLMSEYPLLQDTVRWHHERYDGKGYPNGLSGEEIPLIARIVCVSNAYDAMTSNRVYRKKLTREQIISEFKANSGKQFDPKIVEIILEMIEEDNGFEMQETVINEEKSILVVDDDVVVHDLVETFLKDECYSVTCASSGKEAIKYMECEDFSLCVLDVEMPEMNGFEVLEWINKNKKKMKVMFMTENKSLDVIRRVEKQGVRDYITKPVNALFFRESIRNVLNENR